METEYGIDLSNHRATHIRNSKIEEMDIILCATTAHKNTQIDKIVLNALEEDMPYGDVTTDNLIPEDDVTEAKFIAKAEGVIAGSSVSGS